MWMGERDAASYEQLAVITFTFATIIGGMGFSDERSVVLAWLA
jgi:hypothetical protein